MVRELVDIRDGPLHLENLDTKKLNIMIDYL